MKFSHISDIHLGFSQYGLDEREVDVYQAFDQAIEKSIEDKVEFVIFAGDIFHIPNPKGKPQIKLASALKRLNENKIESYFVLGEHDISNIKDTPIPFVPHKFGFTKYLENGKPFFHKNILIIGFDKFRKQEIHLFQEKFKEAENQATKHNGPKILVMHQGLTEINKFAGELNSTDLPRNFDYYAMGHLHDKSVTKFDHLKGPVVYPGSIEHTDSAGINETEKGFFEVEINESGATESWQRLAIRPQISLTTDVSKLDESIGNLSDKINASERKPIVELIVKGKDIDLDLVESKISELRQNSFYLSLKEKGESIQGHELLSDRPSIDTEMFKLAVKYLENEELAEFATRELLPMLENKDLNAATELVIENYQQFRKGKND